MEIISFLENYLQANVMLLANFFYFKKGFFIVFAIILLGFCSTMRYILRRKVKYTRCNQFFEKEYIRTSTRPD